MSSLNANPGSIGQWLIRKFCAGGAEEISRWWNPKASTQFFAPEAQRTLAGGGARA